MPDEAAGSAAAFNATVVTTPPPDPDPDPDPESEE